MNSREALPQPLNPLGIDGIEFVEYATREPLKFGAVLEMLGFVQVARHRSREVLLYRQGPMNIIVNADAGIAGDAQPPSLMALALRVRDASFAYKHTVELGAWPIPTRAGAMELNIPGIHAVGESIIYFVDRYQDFSIYDVDFKFLPGVDHFPKAVAGMHFFGVVQAIGSGRSADWLDFYDHLLGFRNLPKGEYFGILPKGTLLESPSKKFYIQLIEPPEGSEDIVWDEEWLRLGIGAPDVLAATRELRERGVVFVDRESLHTSEKGALTQFYLNGVAFEFVHSHLQPGK
jgi:4-hydroxyphenylpyruvate dioxygenase